MRGSCRRAAMSIWLSSAILSSRPTVERRLRAARRDRAPGAPRAPPPAAARRRASAIACAVRAASRRVSTRDVVGVRAAGLVAGDDAHAGALRDVLGRLLDDPVLEREALRDAELEVEVGEVGLARDRGGDGVLEHALVEREAVEKEPLRFCSQTAESAVLFRSHGSGRYPRLDSAGCEARQHGGAAHVEARIRPASSRSARRRSRALTHRTAAACDSPVRVDIAARQSDRSARDRRRGSRARAAARDLDPANVGEGAVLRARRESARTAKNTSVTGSRPGYVCSRAPHLARRSPPRCRAPRAARGAGSPRSIRRPRACRRETPTCRDAAGRRGAGRRAPCGRAPAGRRRPATAISAASARWRLMRDQALAHGLGARVVAAPARGSARGRRAPRHSIRAARRAGRDRAARAAARARPAGCARCRRGRGSSSRACR